MSGPVRINGGAPTDPPSGNGRGDDPIYLLPLHERAFRARCEARLILYYAGNMTWEETGFPAELQPLDDDELDDPPFVDNILGIGIGPVEQLDNVLADRGPEALAYLPSMLALLVNLNADEFKTLAHDLHSERPDHGAWSDDEIKQLMRIWRRGRHG